MTKLDLISKQLQNLIDDEVTRRVALARIHAFYAACEVCDDSYSRRLIAELALRHNLGHVAPDIREALIRYAQAH